jgi:hypothetical protein
MNPPLEFTFTPLEDGIRKTVEWFKTAEHKRM